MVSVIVGTLNILIFVYTFGLSFRLFACNRSSIVALFREVLRRHTSNERSGCGWLATQLKLSTYCSELWYLKFIQGFRFVLLIRDTCFLNPIDITLLIGGKWNSIHININSKVYEWNITIQTHNKLSVNFIYDFFKMTGSLIQKVFNMNNNSLTLPIFVGLIEKHHIIFRFGQSHVQKFIMNSVVPITRSFIQTVNTFI